MRNDSPPLLDIGNAPEIFATDVSRVEHFGGMTRLYIAARKGSCNSGYDSGSRVDRVDCMLAATIVLPTAMLQNWIEALHQPPADLSKLTLGSDEARRLTH